MKRSANDPSRHSFNGHTRRALGTALQSGSTQDVGGRRGVHGGEEGKDKKNWWWDATWVGVGWGEISPSTESQLKQIYLKLIWETDCSPDGFQCVLLCFGLLVVWPSLTQRCTIKALWVWSFVAITVVLVLNTLNTSQQLVTLRHKYKI